MENEKQIYFRHGGLKQIHTLLWDTMTIIINYTIITCSKTESQVVVCVFYKKE